MFLVYIYVFSFQLNIYTPLDFISKTVLHFFSFLQAFWINNVTQYMFIFYNNSTILINAILIVTGQIHKNIRIKLPQ